MDDNIRAPPKVFNKVIFSLNKITESTTTIKEYVLAKGVAIEAPTFLIENRKNVSPTIGPEIAEITKNTISSNGIICVKPCRTYIGVSSRKAPHALKVLASKTCNSFFNPTLYSIGEKLNESSAPTAYIRPKTSS